jgi:hypothetical protein
MTDEEIEFEILRIFCTVGNVRFTSFGGFWQSYNSTLHCTQTDFNNVMTRMKSSGYLSDTRRGYIPSEKARQAYNNKLNQKSEREKEIIRNNEKDALELNSLKFTNSRTYKGLTICGMLLGVVGGIFGIAAYYKKDSYSIPEDQIITKEILKRDIDSTRSDIKDDIGESQIQILEIIYADTNIVKK